MCTTVVVCGTLVAQRSKNWIKEINGSSLIIKNLQQTETPPLKSPFESNFNIWDVLLVATIRYLAKSSKV